MENLTPLTLAVPLIAVLWISREILARLRRIPDVPPMEDVPVDRTDCFIAATIAVVFYLLCLWRLGTPGKYVFDEVHHVRTGMEYVLGQAPHEWTHPPFSKLMMAAGMKMWGTHFDPRDGIWKDSLQFQPREAIGWRFFSVVFGSLSLLFTYALTRVFFENRKIAIAATVMLALDGVFFVHSRIGMTNIYTVCFILMGTLGTWLYIKHGKAAWLLLAGLGLGLAMASRWSSLWAWGFNGLLLLWHLWTNERTTWQENKKSLPLELAKWVFRVGASAVILPIIVYLFSYLPYILQGSGSIWTKLFTSGESGPVHWSQVFNPEIRAWGQGWYKVLNQQADMWRYHMDLHVNHPYESPWWSWPLMLRPTWYAFDSKDGNIAGIWAIGNAFIWWATVPALFSAWYLAIRDKKSSLGAVALLGLGMWVCWGIKPRPLIFMHYLFEAIPFACMALAYLGWRFWESAKTNHAPSRDNRWFVIFYGTAIVAWFIFYYPLLSSLPIPEWYFRMHLWLDRMWV